MGYDFRWLADSEQADELSGTATFIVEGRREAVRLESFADAQRICGMIDAAFDSGRRWTRFWVKDRQATVMRELDDLFPPEAE